MAALVQSTGSPIMRRNADRGGPNGCHLKDVDEPEFTVAVGMFTPAEARSIRAAAGDNHRGRQCAAVPFDEAAWNQVLPPRFLEPTTLPSGWDAS